MSLPEVIGVSGTNGSGKDTLAALRAERNNCQHVTVSDILRVQLREDGIPLERENLSRLSRKWREESGDNGILVTRTLQQYIGDKALYGYEGLSVVSIRHPDEAKKIKDIGGTIFWVDASPEIRYGRIKNSQRNRTEDNKTFEEFVEEELRDMMPLSHASVNLGAVQPMADELIINDFGTQDEYHRYLISRFDL